MLNGTMPRSNCGQHAGFSRLSKGLADPEGPSPAVFSGTPVHVDPEIGPQQDERSLNPNAEAGAPTQVEDIFTM
jgi:hypothetical protein